jgi:uroporphyrinogen III methyltransferase/synthase
MEGEVDGLIVATCALQRLNMMNYQSEELPFQTHPLQGHLAVVGIKGGPLKEEFALIDERRKYGRLTIVGAGPGNVGSLTLDGAEALEQADWVYYDDLIGPDVIRRFRKPEQEWFYIGKRSGKHSIEQAEINKCLLHGVQSGHNVVRLKGGDPMIFAHVREEIDYIQTATLMEVRVVPGVTAGVAAAALSQTPLTQRGAASSVAFALGHGKEIQTPNTDTIVYYMCGENIARIAKQLLQAGRTSNTPVRLCCDVTGPKQQFIQATLDEVQYAAMKNTVPTVMIVGKTADCEDYLRLSQKTLHTGTNNYASSDRSAPRACRRPSLFAGAIRLGHLHQLLPRARLPNGPRSNGPATQRRLQRRQGGFGRTRDEQRHQSARNRRHDAIRNIVSRRHFAILRPRSPQATAHPLAPL